MDIVCRRCKSNDVERSYRNPLEEKLSIILPLAPYFCDSCKKRFLWLTDPVMDRNRSIFAGVVGGLLLLFILVSALGGGSEPIPPTTPADTLSDKYAETEAEEPAVPTDDAEATSDTAAPAEGTDTSVAEGNVDETALSPADAAQAALPAGAVPEEGETWSPRVEAQLRRNLAKMQGEPLPETPKPAPAVTRPSNKPDTATPVSPKPAAAKGQIRSVHGAATGAAYVLNIAVSGTVPALKSFSVGNNRFVVDLPGSWSVAPDVADFKADHALIKGVRFGRHKDYFRLVFDLAAPAEIQVARSEANGVLTLTLSAS